MDEVNIHIDEVVFDGASPLSPEHIHEVLSRHADDVQIRQLPTVSRAIEGSLRARLASEVP